MQKKISLIKNIVASNFTRLASPYKATFAATYRCNLKCTMCKIWGHRSLQDEMNIDAIEKTFRGMKNLSWLDLTGGEVTLREEILEIAKIIFAHSKKILIFHISTNGQLPERAFLLAREAARHDAVPVINISVDGPELINDRLRGRQGAYRLSLETFQKIRGLKKAHCYLSCTISKLNIAHIDALLLELKRDVPDFSLTGLHFNLFHNSGHYYQNLDVDASCRLQPGLVQKYLSLSRHGNPIKIFLERAYIRGLARYYRENKAALKCQALSSSCFIDPYGTVYPCSVYDNPVAELRDHDFDVHAVWNSSNSMAVRRGIEKGACPGCWSPCEAYPAILGNMAKAVFS
jgi:MoaA/NifB/PqqE/SkfB family radical SAM enzyme